MIAVRWAAGVALAAVVLAGCSGDGDEGSSAEPTTTSSTAVPEFDGDPDSPFCRRSREAAEQPVLDPFEAGLEPDEVEVRFEALVQRFERFADLAPPELADDLRLLERRLGELAGVLDEAGYDFAQLAGTGVDLGVFDDPALADVAARLAAYQAQVCAT